MQYLFLQKICFTKCLKIQWTRISDNIGIFNNDVIIIDIFNV